MKPTAKTLLTLLLVSLASTASAARLKDIGRFDGARKNQLIGYGLVVGLDGTGDTERASFTPQALEAMLSRLGVRIDKRQLSLRNVAAVTVTADLPAFARPGTQIDVTVSSIGDARSLVGGTLVMTALVGANGQTYAVAQGSISVGSESERKEIGRYYRGGLNAGRITRGALVEREVPVALGDKGILEFTLQRPDFRTAANVADTLNRALPSLMPDLAAAATPPASITTGTATAPVTPPPGPPVIARAIDAGTIALSIPPGWMDRVANFISIVESVEVTPDAVARVVVSGSTGAVVLGGEVRLSRVAIAYEGYSLEIRDPMNEPNRRPTDTLKLVEGGTTLADVVRGLNTLGVTPRQLIDILESLSRAGALHAELEVVP